MMLKRIIIAQYYNGGGENLSLPIVGIIGGILTVLFGLIIIIWPRLIAYVIGAWLIIMGVLAILVALYL